MFTRNSRMQTNIFDMNLQILKTELPYRCRIAEVTKFKIYLQLSNKPLTETLDTA